MFLSNDDVILGRSAISVSGAFSAALSPAGSKSNLDQPGDDRFQGCNIRTIQKDTGRQIKSPPNEAAHGLDGTFEC